jgi:hypothetical protein
LSTAPASSDSGTASPPATRTPGRGAGSSDHQFTGRDLLADRPGWGSSWSRPPRRNVSGRPAERRADRSRRRGPDDRAGSGPLSDSLGDRVDARGTVRPAGEEHGGQAGQSPGRAGPARSGDGDRASNSSGPWRSTAVLANRSGRSWPRPPRSSEDAPASPVHRITVTGRKQVHPLFRLPVDPVRAPSELAPPTGFEPVLPP